MAEQKKREQMMVSLFSSAKMYIYGIVGVAVSVLLAWLKIKERKIEKQESKIDELMKQMTIDDKIKEMEEKAAEAEKKQLMKIQKKKIDIVLEPNKEYKL